MNKGQSCDIISLKKNDKSRINWYFDDYASSYLTIPLVAQFNLVKQFL